MSWSDAARNAMLTGGLTSLINRIGLAPASGTEFSGGGYGGPATPSWATPSSGTVVADPVSIPVPAGTIEWVLFMADGSPDVVHARFPYKAGTVDPIVVSAVAQSSSDTLNSDAHGLVNNDRVALYPFLGLAIPSGLAGPPTLYHVVGATTDTIQVSLTQGGSAVNFTSDGAVTVMQGLPETFAATGSSVVTAKLDARLV